MNMHRIGLAALAAASVAALAACHGSLPSDRQLTLLLHSERAPANDANAPLDVAAVDCVRAWSGDLELTATLSPALVSDVAKTKCKQRIDGWIADATRNPDNVTFERVTRPAAARRAMALLAEHRGNVAQTPANAGDRPPAAPMPQMARTPVPSVEGPPDLAGAAMRLNELDQLCQQAKEMTTGAAAPPAVVRYAGYCAKRVEQLRTRLAEVKLETVEAPQRVFVTAVDQALLAGHRAMEAGPKAPAVPPSNQ